MIEMISQVTIQQGQERIAPGHPFSVETEEEAQGLVSSKAAERGTIVEAEVLDDEGDEFGLDDELPQDFPGLKALGKNEVNLVRDLTGLDRDQLVGMKGIAEATADAILADDLYVFANEGAED